MAWPHRPGAQAHTRSLARPSDGDPTAAPGADAGAGPTLTRPALHPERISSRRAPSPPNGHPPRVRGRPQTRGPGAARAGYKTAGHSPLVPASQHNTSSSLITVSSPSNDPQTRARLVLPLSPSPQPLAPRALSAMCGIFAVLGCADCSQAQRARVLACSRRQAPPPPLHPLARRSSFHGSRACFVLGLLNMWPVTGNCS